MVKYGIPSVKNVNALPTRFGTQKPNIVTVLRLWSGIKKKIDVHVKVNNIGMTKPKQRFYCIV